MNLLSSIFGNEFIVKEMNWIPPKTITGATADGEKYFRREKVERKLWNEIAKGNNILFSAPRRVGKSSIMKYIAENPLDKDYCCEYENISSDDTSALFYKRLLNLIIPHVKSPTTTRLKNWFKRLEIDDISGEGFKITKDNINHKEELLELLPNLKGENKKIVLFLDEFPDVIKNISEKEGIPAAKDVLQTMRSIRHNDDFRNHFCLVLAGSVGLTHIVKGIDRLAVINDLHEQNLPALRIEKLENDPATEAELFIAHLVKGASMKIDLPCSNYLIKKVGQAIPYYLQLMVEACDDLLYDEERTELKIGDINRAWDKVLADNKNFADADERLKDYFLEDYPYFLKILSHCAHHGKLSVQEAFDFGQKLKIGPEFKAKIDDVLIKDGYLKQVELEFTFVSPLLQAWWKNRHPESKQK